MAYYLLDTCILIDFFRGNAEAAQFLESLDNPPFLSSLTVAELYAGVREGKERTALDNFVQHFPIVPLNDEAAIAGGSYRRKYGKSHGVGMIDALLAACAESKNLILTTRNVKHFPMMESVHCPY